MLNHDYIGTEHLLLGLVADEDTTAAQVLISMRVSLTTVQTRVKEAIGVGQAKPRDHLPFTPRSKKVLELSLREALQLGHAYVGTEHILLGLVREGEGIGAQVLRTLGVPLESVRAKVTKLLKERGSIEEVDLPAPSGFTPLCPNCSRELTEISRKAFDTPGTGPGADSVDLVFCGNCGHTLGALPAEPEDE